MLLGLLSDTHLRAPDPRFRDLLAESLGETDVLFHAGDFTGTAVWEHLEYLEPRPCYAVVGNCDPPELADRLPISRVVELDGLRVGLAHGWGAPTQLAERLLLSFPQRPDVLVFGHSHRPEQRRVGETLVVNPGSARQARGNGCSVAVLDTSVRPLQARFVELDP